MMQFSAVFELEPSSVFGLPQGETTVLPARSGEYVGDTYDTWTGARVGYGTLSTYRRLAESLRLDLHVADAAITLHDNYATVRVEASAAATAYEAATRAVDHLLRHLSLSQGRLFEWRPVSLTSEDQRVHPLPRFMQLASVTTFDLPKLADDLANAARLAAIEDERLNRAVDYYEQALLLFERRGRLAQVLSRQHAQLISSVFLNLWKTLATIVGDPSRDSDHQRRYKDLGLDHEFYSKRIRRLHELRNEFDVAHPSLEGTGWQHLESEVGEAVKTVLEVLRRYRNSLDQMDAR